MLSAVPWDAYAQWRQQAFTVGLLEASSVAGEADAERAAGQAQQSFDLIGGRLVQQQFGYTGSGYSVAVVDTGLDYTHPELAGRYLGGWDFVDDDSDPMDKNGHGTHVAGIIASGHSTHRGVAPDAGLIALRVLDAAGSGNFGDVESALQWVIDHGKQYNIVAVNMSLGAGNFMANPWDFLENELAALEEQGVFLAAASGNSFYSYGSQEGLGYPAISEHTVSVGAVWDASYGSVTWASGAIDHASAADRIASFTQRSSRLDLLAPGAFTTSTWLGGKYATLAGTSMAAPVVAAAAVLVHQALDSRGLGHLADQDSILSVLKKTAATVVDGDDEQDNVINTGLSFKRLDLYRAIQSVVDGSGVPSDPGTPGGDSGSGSQAAFVTSLYEELLGRPADAAGLNTWVEALTAGMPRSELVHTVWASAEHRTLQVNSYYATFLGRVPSAAERDYWIASMLAGTSETQVARAFLHSAEYARAQGGDHDFVRELYRDLLGREADAPGLSNWASRLQSGTRRAELVDAVLSSAERSWMLIGDYYLDFLGRPGGDSEKQHWASLVGDGRMSLQSVGETLLASQEYFSRAAGAAVGESGEGRAESRTC